MEQFIQNFIEQVHQLPWWMVFLFFLVSGVLQSTFPPYPGDSVLLFGGCIAGTWLFKGNILMLLPYLLGTIVSSYFLYELGIWKGEKLLESRLIRNFFSPANQAKAKERVMRYGAAVLIVCKFIPGLNSLIIVFCGIFRYRRSAAYLGIAFAAVVHNVIFFILGRLVGRNWRDIVRFLTAYNKVALIVAIAVLIAYICYRIWSGVRKKGVSGAGEKQIP